MSKTGILPFVEAKEILSVLNAKEFAKRYLSDPKIPRFEHKLRGYDSNKKPLDFSEEEKNRIIEAVKRFAAEIKDHPRKAKKKEAKDKK